MNKETTHANTAQAPPGSEALTWRGWQAGAARFFSLHAGKVTATTATLAFVGLVGTIVASIYAGEGTIYGQCNERFSLPGSADPQCVAGQISQLQISYPLLATSLAILVFGLLGTIMLARHHRRVRREKRDISPLWIRLKDWYAGGGLPKERYRMIRTLIEPLQKGRPETLGGQAASKLLLRASLMFLVFAGFMTFFGFVLGWEGADCRREYQMDMCNQLYASGNQTMLLGWAVAAVGLLPLVLGMDLRITSRRLHAALEERIEHEEEAALHLLSAHHREHGPLHLPEEGMPKEPKKKAEASQGA